MVLWTSGDGWDYFVLFGPLCLVNHFTPTSVMLGAPPTMSTNVLVCAEEGVRDSTGEHRFKGASVCRDERRARNYVFEAGREVLMDYGSGIQSTSLEVIRHALETFEASFATEVTTTTAEDLVVENEDIGVTVESGVVDDVDLSLLTL